MVRTIDYMGRLVERLMRFGCMQVTSTEIQGLLVHGHQYVLVRGGCIIFGKKVQPLMMVTGIVSEILNMNCMFTRMRRPLCGQHKCFMSRNFIS